MSCKVGITVLFLFFLIFSANPADAQSDYTAKESPSETFNGAYLTDYTSVLTTRLFLLFQNAALLINTPDDNISKIVYRPNVKVRIGIAGFWKWFGLGLSIDNPLYKTDRDVYGKWFLGSSVQTGFNEVPDKLNNALFSYDGAQFRFWGGTRFDIFKKKKKIHR